MKCPVCGIEIIDNSDDCSICGAKNINPTFINMEDVAEWQKGVDFYKGIWFLEEDSPYMNSLTEEFRSEATLRTKKQLDIYFEYSSLKQKINDDPQNYEAISRMIDYLVQIYTCLMYPVSSRKFVKQEILHYMGLFPPLKITSTDQQICNQAVLSLLSAEVELSDGNVERALSHYYNYLINPIVHQDVETLRNNEYYIETDGDIQYILHNCKELCNLFFSEEVAKFDAILEKISFSVVETNEGSIYMHGITCAIQGPYDVDKELYNFLKCFKKTTCTFERCFCGGVLDTGFNPFNGGHENTILTGCDDNLNRTWSIDCRTWEHNIEETLEKQQYNIQNEINKILRLFGL